MFYAACVLILVSDVLMVWRAFSLPHRHSEALAMIDQALAELPFIEFELGVICDAEFATDFLE